LLGRALDSDGPTDHAGIPSECALPELMAQDDFSAVERPTLLRHGSERPAEDRLNADEGEEIRRNNRLPRLM
jgi:hypothetical protein